MMDIIVPIGLLKLTKKSLPDVYTDLEADFSNASHVCCTVYCMPLEKLETFGEGCAAIIRGTTWESKNAFSSDDNAWVFILHDAVHQTTKKDYCLISINGCGTTDSALMLPQWKRDAISSLEKSIEFFSSKNKFEREKINVRSLLDSIGITYEESELLETEEPVDVSFRDARFQVKEVMHHGRTRHQEIRDALEVAKNASCLEDLLEPYTPRELEVREIVSRAIARSEELERKYGPNEKAELDLLCYCNFNDVYEVKSLFELPEHSHFRSLAVVSNRYRLVIYAAESAPAFLVNSMGILMEKTELGGA